MLTKQEKVILRMICLGFTAKEIAVQLNNSPRTIETHIIHIKTKLDCRKKYELISYAMNNNLICQQFP